MNIINDMLVDKCFPDNANARTVVPAYKDKNASGNPITLTDSAENKPLNMKLYGWSRQDGEPSPENPVEIESAGDDGKIGVSVTGKNLFHVTKASDCNKGHSNSTKRIILPGEYVVGISANNYIGGGISSSKSHISTEKICFEPKTSGYGIGVGMECTAGREYTISYKSGKNLFTGATFYQKDGSYISYTNGNRFIVPENTEYTVIVFKCTVENTGYEISYENIQMEEAAEKTAYEPYRTPQSTSIATPNGLPGIPVPSNTAGITYTDADGQAWIADEIDLERRKYVQRVWEGVFDGSSDEEWVLYQTAGYLGFAIDVLPQNMVRRYGFCTYYKLEYAATTDEAVWIGVDNKRIYVKNNSFYDASLADKGLSNFKSRLTANPLIVMTYLDTPIERDLTSAELAEYTQLYSYKPTTVVENDSGCWMDVTYKAGTSGKSKNEALRWYFKNVMPLVE